MQKIGKILKEVLEKRPKKSHDRQTGVNLWDQPPKVVGPKTSVHLFVDYKNFIVQLDLSPLDSGGP